ncbi:hypothetical protein D3C83_121850 [compost metagenome]
MNHFVEKRVEPVKMAVPRVLFAESPRCLSQSRLRSSLKHVQNPGFELIRVAGIVNDAVPQAPG